MLFRLTRPNNTARRQAEIRRRLARGAQRSLFLYCCWYYAWSVWSSKSPGAYFLSPPTGFELGKNSLCLNADCEPILLKFQPVYDSLPYPLGAQNHAFLARHPGAFRWWAQAKYCPGTAKRRFFILFCKTVFVEFWAAEDLDPALPGYSLGPASQNWPVPAFRGPEMASAGHLEGNSGKVLEASHFGNFGIPKCGPRGCPASRAFQG